MIETDEWKAIIIIRDKKTLEEYYKYKHVCESDEKTIERLLKQAREEKK